MKRSPPAGTPLPLRLFTTFFLIGEAAPFAPATFASLALLPLLFPYLSWPLWGQVLAAAIVLWTGVLGSTRAEKYYGHDAGAIVIDEVAGMLVTFLLITPAADARSTWLLLFIGFFFFRVFDVLKPYPANRAQNLPGGIGVMMDDIVAGLYANLALRVTSMLL